MSDLAAANATAPAAVASVLADLAAAYFERMAAGDWARASVVLSVFQTTFRQYRSALIQLMMAVSDRPDPALIPGDVDSTYSASTRRGMQVAFMLDTTPRAAVPIVEAMPTATSGISAWWPRMAPFINARAQAFATAIAADSVRTLAQNLLSRVNARLQGGAAETVRDERETPFDVPTPDGSVLAPIPGTQILVGPSRWTMPTWGWWALGLGAVAAGGVVFWGVTRKGRR